MTENQTPNSEEERLNKTEARQGTHTFGLRVLVISMVLIVTGFVIAYLAVVLMDTPQDTVSTEPAPPEASEVEPPPNVPPADETPAEIEVPAE